MSVLGVQLGSLDGVDGRAVLQRWPWVAATLACLLVCWTAVGQLVDVWEDDGAYAHGYAVVVAAVLLLLRDAPRVPRRKRVLVLASVMLACCALLWGMGDRAGVVTLSTTAAVFCWVLLCWMMARVSWHTALAPALLLLAAPLWNFAVPVLQQFTIAANRLLLGLFEIPALVSGDTVQLPAGQFVIEGGCAGLRFQLAALTLVGVIGLWRRLPLLALLGWGVVAMVLALILNQLRVFAIIVIGNSSQMQNGLVDDHAWFGWVLFLLIFTPFIALFQRYADTTAAPVVAPISAPAGPVDQAGFGFALLLGLLALCVGPLWLVIAELPGQAPIVNVPAAPGWHQEPSTSSWHPQFAPARYQAASAYVSGGRRVDVYTAGYPKIAGQQGLFSEGVLIVDGLRWHQARLPEALALDPAWPVNSARVVDRSGRQRLVVWWYQLSDQRFASPGRAKLGSMVGIARGQPAAATLIAVSTLCVVDCTDAKPTLDQFLDRHYASQMRARTTE